MDAPSLLTGDNAAFLDDLYQQWLQDPDAVPADWAQVFEGYQVPDNGHGLLPGQAPRPRRRSIFAAKAAEAPAVEGELQAKVVQMINTYRVRGHMQADIDPLGRRKKVIHPELTLEYYGLSEADLDREVGTEPLYGMPERASLREVLEHCERTYAHTIGAEFMNINSLEEKLWVQEALETLPNRTLLTAAEERRILRKLADAENFERMLHTRFPGTKRFSLEGAETLIPLMDLLIEQAAEHGVLEIVIGMAHRGRLNVLTNILEKPPGQIVREFEDTQTDTWQGSGDVKYHLGYSSDVKTLGGHDIHLSLAFNPSHLEAVDSVVEGRVRAKQDRAGDHAHETGMAVLLHGDAAFSGQGVVSEVLNLSQLHGYRTGGTLHVVVNNQIGFTTPPIEGRSTPYATDVARMLGIPIFHVNGEDPRAVAAVVQIAHDWRQEFHKDVVIDMYCYRKHGHNEGDEPSFTQPLMYEEIRSRPTPREVFEKHLVDEGTLEQSDADEIVETSLEAIEQAVENRGEREPEGSADDRAVDTKAAGDDVDVFMKRDDDATVEGGERDGGDPESLMKGLWARYRNGSIGDETDTRFDEERLYDLLVRANTLPESFNAHRKVKRLVDMRRAMAEGERGIGWATAEQAAFASLLVEGWRVRLSGQDSGRGTFSQRHALLTDVDTGEEYYPLQHLADDQGGFDAIDSSLSEFAVLGFEYGYTLDYPDALVVWEAQFGDFANGAQVIIDQFVANGEQKWNRLSGLVLLLPHGYEGQGPEHSSARMERFLQLCGEENIQVANCTTPANFFHLLRRQVLRHVRKPLIVMTPKSLLRHKECTSTLSDLAGGRFHRVLDDDDDLQPEQVKRVVLCQGKVYYDLLEERRERDLRDVALVRLELLHPFPAEALDAVLAKYPDGVELVWCQEEPKNQGPWPVFIHWMLDHFGVDGLPRYVGRPASASPATGSHTLHERQQRRLVDEALSL